MLLDSGAQVSLIRQGTAETLGLKGKDVSITITKVGGEDETIKTKEYNVQLTCIDNNKRFTVKAIGIHGISDEIPAVKTSHLPEVFGVPNTRFRRGKGHVDLLIGIDHVHMHAGETRQVDHLLARKSPLGWVDNGSHGRGRKTLCLRCRQTDSSRKRKSQAHRGVVFQSRKPMDDPLPVEERP